MRPAWEARPVEDAAPAAAGLPERDEIASYHLMDEMRLVGGLVERAIFTATERNRIADRASRLVSAARANSHKQHEEEEEEEEKKRRRRRRRRCRGGGELKAWRAEGAGPTILEDRCRCWLRSPSVRRRWAGHEDPGDNSSV